MRELAAIGGNGIKMQPCSINREAAKEFSHEAGKMPNNKTAGMTGEEQPTATIKGSSSTST